MSVFHHKVSLPSHGTTPTFTSVNDAVREAIGKSGIRNGIVAVMSPHTTCGVYFDEFAHDLKDDGSTDFLQDDLNACLAKIIPDQTAFPPDKGYQYPGEAHFTDVETWPNALDYLPGGDRSALLNADAHIKSSIIGSSATFPVVDGELGFGVTGYIFFVDFDRSPRGRVRTCQITIIGE